MNNNYLGEKVKIVIDRKLGSTHPKWENFVYPLNYGFVPNTISGDNKELDAYLLGVFEPVDEYEGTCISIIHRTNDNDDKLIIVPNGIKYNKKQIIALTEFQERFFESEIIMHEEKRITARGVIISEGYVYLMFRRKIKDDLLNEYYVIPGGGIEEGETLHEALTRELKEELSIEVDILGFLGTTENDKSRGYFFSCSILNNEIPKLGGPELIDNNENNYYEIRKVPIKDIDNLDIVSKEMILKAYKKEYIELVK